LPNNVIINKWNFQESSRENWNNSLITKYGSLRMRKSKHPHNNSKIPTLSQDPSYSYGKRLRAALMKWEKEKEDCSQKSTKVKIRKMEKYLWTK
jgi:hypothetical protein